MNIDNEGDEITRGDGGNLAAIKRHLVAAGFPDSGTWKTYLEERRREWYEMAESERSYRAAD